MDKSISNMLINVEIMRELKKFDETESILHSLNVDELSEAIKSIFFKMNKCILDKDSDVKLIKE